MKKYLSLALALAMLISASALAACDSSTDETEAPAQSSTPASGDNGDTTEPAGDATTADPGNTTQPEETEGNDDPATPDPDPVVDPFDEQFHGYEPIDNLEAYKAEHVNLTALYFDGLEMSQSIFSGNDWTESEDETFAGLGNEDAPNLFDCDPETKWCCARSLVEMGNSAVVWRMSKAVDVTAYSITTANDNVEWPSRNPVQWRLYGCTELPETVVTDVNPDEGDTYLSTYTVPEGWTLIDAVDAADPDDPMISLVPDENFKEIGLEPANPGTYQYFMLIIDYCEGDDITFQLADLTLYGNDN